MSRWRLKGKVWCNWPTRPRAIIEMVGGSYLSASPNISYKSFLEGLLKHNFAIHAWCYIPGFDHQAQANHAWKDLRSCRHTLEDRLQSKIKIIRLGHSLGCKLHLLAPDGGRNSNGLISISFNNFSVNKSIPMINDIASRFNIKPEFRPSPIETMKLIAHNYNQPKNLIINFSNDRLDESQKLIDVLNQINKEQLKHILLEGDHLTPVSSGMTKNMLVNWNNKNKRANNLNRLIEVISLWI